MPTPFREYTRGSRKAGGRTTELLDRLSLPRKREMVGPHLKTTFFGDARAKVSRALQEHKALCVRNVQSSTSKVVTTLGPSVIQTHCPMMAIALRKN